MPVLQEQKRVIACIDDQLVIDKTLSHLEKKGEFPSMPDTLPETRAPHQSTSFTDNFWNVS